MRAAMRKHQCQRAILVGHNAHFDLNFLNAAVARTQSTHSRTRSGRETGAVCRAGVAAGEAVFLR